MTKISSEGSAGTTPLVALAFDDGAGNAVRVSPANGVNVKPSPATNTAGFASSAASTNPTQVKNSPGTLRQVSGYNAAPSARYLRFYDTAGAPVAGTTAIRKRVYLPPLAGFVFDYNDAYAAGIAFAITAASPDNDTTVISAGDILAFNVDYL